VGIEDFSTRVICTNTESDERRERRMETDTLFVVTQATCDHARHRWYTRRRFDILNGFEIVQTRCLNCHKTLALEIKKLN
jgi:hypothetical protein